MHVRVLYNRIMQYSDLICLKILVKANYQLKKNDIIKKLLVNKLIYILQILF